MFQVKYNKNSNIREDIILENHIHDQFNEWVYTHLPQIRERMPWTKRGAALGLKKGNKKFYHGKRIVDQEEWEFVRENSTEDLCPELSPNVWGSFVYRFKLKNAFIDAVVWVSQHYDPLSVELIDHLDNRIFEEFEHTSYGEIT